MFTLVESEREKVKVQRQLIRELAKAWNNKQLRIVMWRPTAEELRIQHNDRYWFASVAPRPDSPVPKYWNSFGAYHQNGNLRIGVEINIPTTTNSRRIAGFFARNAEAICLMHDGSVGGGSEGVGREGFLSWSESSLVKVMDSNGSARPGIAIAVLGSRTLGDDVARFIELAVNFRRAVQRGELKTVDSRRRQREFKEYYDEFSGTKRRGAMLEVEYISRHGDIVRALRDWRETQGLGGASFTKNPYIDLGVLQNGKLEELYEVKTSSDRQCLYTAIGQVTVHVSNSAAKRYIVLPSDGDIPSDIAKALGRDSIEVLRFSFIGEKVHIHLGT
ncbi:MAG TPA: hypothetical protein VHT03_00790 [Rhizomicrobium sp.]|jgi:hypothetical protein|nr:hypothetical protein [Rhizomicrobium sp.]